ncbi:Rho termination factor N-terminal domain-containing protein [Leifsonia sp. LS-T14]|uniref:Rho termination factor N-terminal domain-containing protein n=1 Tax=unclassified Leifsonia TaxID=2663824 RepID=UPI0035A5BC46
MAKLKKLEKAAAKALKRAEKAVAEAREAADKLGKKKARTRARELEKELAGLVGGGAARSGDHSSAADVDLTPPLPSVRDDTVESVAEFAGSVTTPVPHDAELDQLSVQALRDVARARGLRNVSRLTKGQLIERLSE